VRLARRSTRALSCSFLVFFAGSSEDSYRRTPPIHHLLARQVPPCPFPRPLQASSRTQRGETSRIRSSGGLSAYPLLRASDGIRAERTWHPGTAASRQHLVLVHSSMRLKLRGHHNSAGLREETTRSE